MITAEVTPTLLKAHAGLGEVSEKRGDLGFHRKERAHLRADCLREHSGGLRLQRLRRPALPALQSYPCFQ